MGRLKWFSIAMGRKSKSSSSFSSSSGVGSAPSTPPNASSPSAFRTAQDAGGFCQLFDHLDADGDGRISAADLESSLSRVGGGWPGCARGDAASMLWAADLDGDGYISLEELASVCGARDEAVQGREEELRSAFEVYDRNGDGVISAEELHQVLCGVMGRGAATVEECRGMIRAVDCDGDGAVSFEEFAKMMTSQSSLIAL